MGWESREEKKKFALRNNVKHYKFLQRTNYKLIRILGENWALLSVRGRGWCLWQMWVGCRDGACFIHSLMVGSSQACKDNM